MLFFRAASSVLLFSLPYLLPRTREAGCYSVPSACRIQKEEPSVTITLLQVSRKFRQIDSLCLCYLSAVMLTSPPSYCLWYHFISQPFLNNTWSTHSKWHTRRVCRGQILHGHHANKGRKACLSCCVSEKTGSEEMKWNTLCLGLDTVCTRSVGA